MDNAVLLENKLTAEQFCKLQEAVGFGSPNISQIEIAIKNTIYSLSIEVEDEIVGMGRLIGDGARIFYIQDVFITPEFQGKGIGKLIVEKLFEYVKNNSIKNSYVTVGLMAAKYKEGFYQKLEFRVRPNDKEGNGMMINFTL